MSSFGITQFHACYFAHELTKRCPSDSLQKLAATLADAQDAVDTRKDALLTKVEARLKQTVTRTELFTVRWRIK